MSTQLKNLEVLLAAVQAQPETLFDLSHYRQQSACGTMFCTAGLATTLPHFQEQGFYMAVSDGSPAVEGYTIFTGFTGVKVGEKWIFDKDVAQQFFGGHFDDLFNPAGCGDVDGILGYDGSWDDNRDEYTANMTDKELAIARLTYTIEQLKEQA